MKGYLYQVQPSTYVMDDTLGFTNGALSVNAYLSFFKNFRLAAPESILPSLWRRLTPSPAL